MRDIRTFPSIQLRNIAYPYGKLVAALNFFRQTTTATNPVRRSISWWHKNRTGMIILWLFVGPIIVSYRMLRLLSRDWRWSLSERGAPRVQVSIRPRNGRRSWANGSNINFKTSQLFLNSFGWLVGLVACAWIKVNRVGFRCMGAGMDCRKPEIDLRRNDCPHGRQKLEMSVDGGLAFYKCCWQAYE